MNTILRFAIPSLVVFALTLASVAQTPEEAAEAAGATGAASDASAAVADAAVPAEPTPPADPVAETTSSAEATAPAEATPPADPQPTAAEVPTPAEEPAAEAAVAEVTEPAEMAAPAEPAEASVVVTPIEPAPAPAVEYAPTPAAPACCPIAVVDYRTTLAAKRAYRCYGPGVETTVCVDNPADCTCTQYAVPLCVPGCCVGEPKVCHAGPGLLGRGKVELVWDCGFTATVIFRAHGGAIVVYGG